MLSSLEIYSIKINNDAINKRVQTLNNFVFSLQQDLERQVYVSGFRSVFLIEKKIDDTGDFIDNFNLRLRECFFNGTLYNENQDLMNGAKYNDIMSNLNTKARTMNINITITNPEITAIQEDPWNIKVTLKGNITITDLGKLALWNKSLVITSYIPIEGFEDPLYVAGSHVITNKINRTLSRPFVNGNDVSNLSKHVQGSFYKESIYAPNFLMRFTGNFSSDNNGIESFVNLQKLDESGGIIEHKSCIDHIYFSEDNPPVYSVPGMPPWFLIDDLNDSLTEYGVGGLAVPA